MEFDFSEEPTLSCDEPPLDLTLGSLLGTTASSHDVTDRRVLKAAHTFVAGQQQAPEPIPIPTTPVPPQIGPSEEKFVAAQASVRAQAYEDLGAVLDSGRLPEHFAPWFQEMLRDADTDAFIAACRAVSMHYRAAQDNKLPAMPPVWLGSLAERLKLGTASKAECDAAAHLFATTEQACRQCLWAQVTELLSCAGRAAETWWLLAICGERNSCSSEEIRLALVNDTVQQHLQQGGTTLHTALKVLSSALPGMTGVALPASTPAPAGGWAMSPEHPQRSFYSHNGVLGGPDSPGAAQLLGETSLGSWRQRLKCLQELHWPVEDGLPPVVLWPHLVLQAEDDHPAVSAAALQAIARLAPHLPDPGDLQATRLAAVLRNRLRDGRARSVDAASTCVADISRHGIFAPQQLANFLSQALGCTRERAKATVTLLREEFAGTGHGVAPPALNSLLHAASTGRRLARSTPARRSRTPTTPSPRSVFTAAAASPVMPGGLQSHLEPSPHTLDGHSSILRVPAFSPAMSPAPLGFQATASTIAGTPWNISSIGPARCGHLFDSPEESEERTADTIPSASPQRQQRSPGVNASPAPSNIASGTSRQGCLQTPPRRPATSPYVSSPDTLRRQAAKCSEDGSGTREPHVSQNHFHAWHIQQVPEDVIDKTPAPQRRQSAQSLVYSSEPQLTNHSRLVRLSRSLRSGMDRVSTGSQMAPVAMDTAGQDDSGAPHAPSQQPIAQTDEEAESVYGRLQVALTAIRLGRRAEDLPDAFAALSAWQASPSHDAEAAAEILSLVLEVAPDLSPEGIHTLWSAMQPLTQGSYGKADEAVLLDIVVKHILAIMDPEAVAEFLARCIASKALAASSAVDYCMLEMQDATPPMAEKTSYLIWELAKAILKGSEQKSLSLELTLMALPSLMEWATAKECSCPALPPLRSAVELLVQHLSPTTIPRTCWRQMRTFLGSVPRLPASFTPQEWDKGQSKLDASEISHLSIDHFSIEASELAVTMRRLQRLVVELSKAEADEVPDIVQQVTQAVSKSSCIPHLRAFSQRLLLRQRQRGACKENFAPIYDARGKPGNDAATEFLDDDYACARELCADEGLAGAFPNSLIGHLKRLLSSPSAAGTPKAVSECISALVQACGRPLLRVTLRHFAASLLRLAAARGPSQASARGALVQLIRLEVTDAGSTPKRSSCFRLCWRALLQAAGRRAGGGGDANLLTEVLRCYSEDIFPDGKLQVETAEASRDFLAVAAPALRDRSVHLRRAASEAISALMLARGSEEALEEDIKGHAALQASTKAAALSVLAAARDNDMRAVMSMSASPAMVRGRGASHSPRSQRGRSPRTAQRLRRTPSTPSLSSTKGLDAVPAAASDQRRRRLQFSPMLADSPPVALVGSSSAILRESSAPVACLAQGAGAPMSSMSICSRSSCQDASPAPLRASEDAARVASQRRQHRSSRVTPITTAPDTFSAVSSTAPHELEDNLHEWVQELRLHHATNRFASRSIWQQRVAGLRTQVEMHFGRYTPETTVTALPGLFLLCQHLVAAAADMTHAGDISMSHGLLESAHEVVKATRGCLEPQVLKLLCTPTAAIVFRAALYTLAVLQHLSSGSSTSPGKEAATSMVLELPPLIAQLLDTVHVHAQLLAWLRVGSEVMTEVQQPGNGSSADIATGRLPVEIQTWACRFCTRCLERLLPQLQASSGPDFPAWEVMSQLSQLQAQLDQLQGPDHQIAWADDLHAWRRTLEAAAQLVEQLYPSEVKEFLLLARCTGSPVPKSLLSSGEV